MALLLASAAFALLVSPVPRPTVSLCSTRCAADHETFRNHAKQDFLSLMAAANCCGHITLELCDNAESFLDRQRQWEDNRHATSGGAVATLPSAPVAAVHGLAGSGALSKADGGAVAGAPHLQSGDAAEIGRIALRIDDGSGSRIDRFELRLLLAHGLLRLLEYDPNDPSRAKGSVAATGSDGEAREMATAERLLLRRLGWDGAPIRCSTDSPHGARGGFEQVPWGVVARDRPDAWWLHDRHSHEGRRWRAAATKRFRSVCGRRRRAPVMMARDTDTDSSSDGDADSDVVSAPSSIDLSEGKRVTRFSPDSPEPGFDAKGLGGYLLPYVGGSLLAILLASVAFSFLVLGGG